MQGHAPNNKQYLYTQNFHDYSGIFKYPTVSQSTTNIGISLFFSLLDIP